MIGGIVSRDLCASELMGEFAFNIFEINYYISNYKYIFESEKKKRSNNFDFFVNVIQ